MTEIIALLMIIIVVELFVIGKYLSRSVKELSSLNRKRFVKINYEEPGKEETQKKTRRKKTSASL